jgi:hypothetical protein
MAVKMTKAQMIQVRKESYVAPPTGCWNCKYANYMCDSCHAVIERGCVAGYSIAPNGQCNLWRQKGQL